MVIFENSSGNTILFPDCLFLPPVRVKLGSSHSSGLREIFHLEIFGLIAPVPSPHTQLKAENDKCCILANIQCLVVGEAAVSCVRADNCLEGWVVSSCGYDFNLIGLPENESWSLWGHRLLLVPWCTEQLPLNHFRQPLLHVNLNLLAVKMVRK